jgi:hypothetical protein
MLNPIFIPLVKKNDVKTGARLLSIQKNNLKNIFSYVFTQKQRRLVKNY